jgi:hypothetical protein
LVLTVDSADGLTASAVLPFLVAFFTLLRAPSAGLDPQKLRIDCMTEYGTQAKSELRDPVERCLVAHGLGDGSDEDEQNKEVGREAEGRRFGLLDVAKELMGHIKVRQHTAWTSPEAEHLDLPGSSIAARGR